MLAKTTITRIILRLSDDSNSVRSFVLRLSMFLLLVISN